MKVLRVFGNFAMLVLIVTGMIALVGYGRNWGWPLVVGSVIGLAGANTNAFGQRGRTSRR